MYGNVIHHLSDTFAHSAVVKGEVITHKTIKKVVKGKIKEVNAWEHADNELYYPKRWDCASQAVASALKKYNSNIDGSWSDYYPVCTQHIFQLANIYENIKAVFGEGAASSFKNRSLSFK